MAASVIIPLATSQRTIAVKVMDENRRIINQHRTLLGRSKVSYTHIIGWAIVRALEDIPGLNHAYAEKDGQPYRVVRPQINLGVAADVAGKDGTRSLVVPNIKNAGALNFQEYLTAFDDLIARARTAKLTPADFQGTTLSLTNPGTVGTMFDRDRENAHRRPDTIPQQPELVRPRRIVVHHANRLASKPRLHPSIIVPESRRYRIGMMSSPEART